MGGGYVWDGWPGWTAHISHGLFRIGIWCFGVLSFEMNSRVIGSDSNLLLPFIALHFSCSEDLESMYPGETGLNIQETQVQLATTYD